MTNKPASDKPSRWPLWVRRCVRRLRDRNVLVPVCVVASVVLFAVVAGLVVLRLTNPSSRPPSGFRAPLSFPLSLEASRFLEHEPIKINATAISGLAVDAEDRIYVGGEQSILIISRFGESISEIPLSEAPRCFAVGGASHQYPGRLYVGLRDHVEVFDSEGRAIATWTIPVSGALLDEIAVGSDFVCVTEKTSKAVFLFTPDGEPLPPIHQGASRDADEPGRFAIYPNSHFPVRVAPDGLIWVVNPGMHRLEAYTMDGDWLKSRTWGSPSQAVEGFCGCCNPTGFDIFPDGRFVTTEKFLLRVKIYSPHGELLAVVAEPRVFDLPRGMRYEPDPRHPIRYLRVAIDSAGRVLVLDPAVGQIHVFEERRS